MVLKSFENLDDQIDAYFNAMDCVSLVHSEPFTEPLSTEALTEQYNEINNLLHIMVGKPQQIWDRVDKECIVSFNENETALLQFIINLQDKHKIVDIKPNVCYANNVCEKLLKVDYKMVKAVNGVYRSQPVYSTPLMYDFTPHNLANSSKRTYSRRQKHEVGKDIKPISAIPTSLLQIPSEMGNTSNSFLTLPPTIETLLGMKTCFLSFKLTEHKKPCLYMSVFNAQKSDSKLYKKIFKSIFHWPSVMSYTQTHSNSTSTNRDCEISQFDNYIITNNKSGEISNTLPESLKPDNTGFSVLMAAVEGKGSLVPSVTTSPANLKLQRVDNVNTYKPANKHKRKANESDVVSDCKKLCH